MRVLHVLHHSVPYVDGYSIRSRFIVETQRALGLTPSIVTSAHHEIEVGRRDHVGPLPTETIGGLPYRRTPLPGGRTASVALGSPFLRERALMRVLRASVDDALAAQPVDVVHAHSPVLCGLPALEAAHQRGVAFVYEARAFWEDALLAQPRSAFRRLKYRFSRRLETSVFRNADAVVAISRHMVHEIVSRGVPQGRVFEVPNGVDVGAFPALPPDEDLLERHGLRGKAVVGFIGSFYQFEGLDCLLKAMRRVVDAQPQSRLVLVGGGEQEGALRRQAGELRLDDHVTWVGRVSHGDVPRYYSVIDLLVYPRHRDRITELVTPLKPLEAMAMGKPVVGSDVGGILELLDHGRVGAFFEAGNAEQLATRILELLADPHERKGLAHRGREYVSRERDWSKIVTRYLPIYEQAIGRRCGRTARA